MPILWHVMKIYASHGIVDFIVCPRLQEPTHTRLFFEFISPDSRSTIDLADNVVTIHKARAEPWRVTLVETGAITMTGGRIKQAAEYLGADESFCLTYADGLSNVDLGRLIQFHRKNDRLVTVTAVETPDRFGRIAIQDGRAFRFDEKPHSKGDWVNAGYFVVSRRAVALIEGDRTVWRESRSSASSRTDSSACTVTPVSGCAWTRRRTGRSSKTSGRREMRPGMSGKEKSWHLSA